MARNNPKPTDKVDWDATGEITSPSAGRKTAGWLFNIKPPAQNFNWLWNLLGLQQFYSNAQVQDWIVIDSDADERDYATLTAYLADAPAAGDRLLIKQDQTVTVQTVIPDDITLKFLDGSRLLCATNIATSVLQMGSDIIIEGVLSLILSQAGTTDKAIEYNGDNVVGRIDVENSSTGTLTTAHSINSGKTGNQIKGFAQNTGGGTLTNALVDNSTEDSNDIQIVDDSNNIVVRSNGANTFDAPTIADASNIVDSTTTVSGVVELATNAETITGSDTARAVTPAGLQSKVSSATAKGIVELATGAEVKTGTDAERAVPPSAMAQHEGIIKAWVNLDGEGGASIQDSYNVSGVVRNSVGDYTISWDTDFANANYAVVVTGSTTAVNDNVNVQVERGTVAVGSITINCRETNTGVSKDVDYIAVIAIGDQ